MRRIEVYPALVPTELREVDRDGRAAYSGGADPGGVVCDVYTIPQLQQSSCQRRASDTAQTALRVLTERLFAQHNQTHNLIQRSREIDSRYTCD